ncbi:hypothetical protein BDEG_20702 [Batrachochytrium dendrobatidis JEL423]|uniref:DNA helicase n=1 Tax=Batrachochytrium dendrobatidis (strain JEL423) TaxID=403673 RepID=A0A177W8Y4_BATDL|nr:hypothetical protein BDEG_20702 [Batrachochytrium dendrobatidis JEL423]
MSEQHPYRNSGNGRGRGQRRGGAAGQSRSSYAPYPAHDTRPSPKHRESVQSHYLDDEQDLMSLTASTIDLPPSLVSAKEHRPNSHGKINSNCPYPCWHLYLPNDEFSYDGELVAVVRQFQVYFTALFDRKYETDSQEAYDRLVSQPLMPVDYKDVSSTLPDFDTRLKTRPLQLLGCMGLAATAVAMKLRRIDEDFDPVYDRKIVRIMHYPLATPLKDLKASLMGKSFFLCHAYGKFISVRGTVVRVSSIRPLTTQIAMRCTKCDNSQTQVLQDGKFGLPVKCETFRCRGKSFQADRSADSSTHTIDWQRIRIQEKLADDQVDSGRIPRTVECELILDLVDSVVPGDVVSVAGVVKVLATDEGKKRSATQMYYLYIDVNSLSKAGALSVDQDDSTVEQGTGLGKDYLHFSHRELMGIRHIHEQPETFKLLVHSLCPPIFGHDIVKAGLLLVLFGARRRDKDAQGVSIRSDPHILIVGDPGLGKSQMLAATVRAAPRGVYVCGNTTTTSGLTVTVCKDSDTGDTALEAGALVLGDQGVCCIDEFDKMGEHQALLEAMEQQSISIAKAGIICSLPARTSVIAAANPVGDRPDEQMDMFLSDHIMKLHSGALKSVSGFEEFAKNAPEHPKSGLGSSGISDRTLLEYLRVGKDEELNTIPLPLLRKYIAYARTYTKPRLSHEAAAILQKFYLTLRSNYRSVDSTPITTRQLESMIRLSEARARSELREVVTEQDAQDVIQIMKISLWDTYEDGLTATRVFGFTGSGTSKKGEPKRFVVELQRIAKQKSSNRFSYDELYTAAQCYLLKKGFRQYQLCSA